MQTRAFPVAETNREGGLHFQARACLQDLEGLEDEREDDVMQVLCIEGGKSDTAQQKIGLLDLGVSEVPVDQVTDEIPNSAQELRSRHVVATPMKYEFKNNFK